jgi:hypothetical protein
MAQGYLTRLPRGEGFEITKAAFDLVEEVEPSKIFISYKRSDSSAFALLVLARLKQYGLDPFLDMTIQPGEDWHAQLKENIQKRDYFVLLLGKQTLKSDVVLKEISWALEAQATIIPVWHNGFRYRAERWGLSLQLDDILRNTHSIQVKEESASGYNTGLVELLNRLGITP